VKGQGTAPPERDDLDRSATKEVVEIRSTSMNQDDPIVEEVVRCEDLPPGSLAGRRMIVRWSDGTEGEAVRFYQDEVLFSEGDLVGRTREQIRSLHFCRDRDWLQS
jgi:hypothetical protein